MMPKLTHPHDLDGQQKFDILACPTPPTDQPEPHIMLRVALYGQHLTDLVITPSVAAEDSRQFDLDLDQLTAAYDQLPKGPWKEFITVGLPTLLSGVNIGEIIEG